MIPKFRAYSKEENEMYYPHNDKNVDWTIDDETGFIAPLVNLGGGMWGMIDKYELMQSTGLKDKNGVDIFEGDLVKKFSNINKFTDDFAEDIEPTYGTTSIVRDGACFKTTFKGLPSLVLNQNGGSMAKHMEVIGNVWENPELLEQANES
ncbi:YopX family protein [Enterococcus casseliflavus]|uniref:YopX family protein n=1 Tax=Enterococcus casseliflavus TaxID=37734 RepID=UPI00177B2907|nr:YopX family protein [Enterococcus casseliflavus]QOG30881.1 DNA-packaging protein [Enterococcus casseliflavus]